MTTARKHLINDTEVGTYHIITRCVRQCWLLNNDEATDRDFSSRKQMIYDLLEKYAKSFCIDIGGYSIMSNHLHLVLRNRPDLLEKLSDEEIAYRWLLLHPTKEAKKDSRDKPNDEEIHSLFNGQKSISLYRNRLGRISHFMQEFSQTTARKCNKEDNRGGRFWEGRFDSQYLADRTAVLACMVYVDLNPIRAKVTDSIKESKFTSAYDRMHTETAKMNIQAYKKNKDKKTYKQIQEYKYQYKVAHSDKWLAKIQRNRTEKTNPILCMTKKDYFELLDFTGREIHNKKPDYIPEKIPTILDQMDINHEKWLEQIQNYGSFYYRVLGHIKNIKSRLKSTKQKWFQGSKKNQELYLST